MFSILKHLVPVFPRFLFGNGGARRTQKRILAKIADYRRKSDLPIANLHAQFWLRMQFAFDSSGPGGPILRQLQMHNGNVFEFRHDNYGFALRHENFGVALRHENVH